MKTQNIFGLRVDSYERQELETLLKRVLKIGPKASKLPICIATLNPEILLKAKRDHFYKKCLDSFELKIADGFGIVLCSLLKRKNFCRYQGADLAEMVLQKGLEEKLKTTLILTKEGLSSRRELEEVLDKRFGRKRASLCKIVTKGELEQKGSVLLSKTEILLVGLGAPNQEFLIQKLKHIMPKLRVAIGVGGTFDYWTKKQIRSPKLLRLMGLEWFWRLLSLGKYSHKKSRVKRIFSAVFIFPVKYFFDNR